MRAQAAHRPYQSPLQAKTARLHASKSAIVTNERVRRAPRYSFSPKRDLVECTALLDAAQGKRDQYKNARGWYDECCRHAARLNKDTLCDDAIRRLYWGPAHVPTSETLRVYRNLWLEAGLVQRVETADGIGCRFVSLEARCAPKDHVDGHFAAMRRARLDRQNESARRIRAIRKWKNADTKAETSVTRRSGDVSEEVLGGPKSHPDKTPTLYKDLQGERAPTATAVGGSEKQRSCDADVPAGRGSSDVLKEKKLKQDPQGPEPTGIAPPPHDATASVEEGCKVADATVADAPTGKFLSRTKSDFASMAANLVAFRHAQGWVSADEPANSDRPSAPQTAKSQQDASHRLALVPKPHSRKVTQRRAISFQEVQDANRTWNLKLTAWKVADAGFSYATLVDAVAKVLHNNKRGRNIEGRIMIVACKLRDERGERCGPKSSGPRSA